MIKGVEVDIYIEKYKICVFADGPDHFKMPRDKRKNPRKKDAEDNEHLMSKPNPHKVERFTTADVMNNLRKCIFTIIERLPLKLKKGIVR
jgi:very-short-patch-repair endonuclease